MPSKDQRIASVQPRTTHRLQQLLHLMRMAVGARTHDRVFTGPLYVQVGVVNSCNYRCVFCWDQPTFVHPDAPWPDAITKAYYTEHPEIDRNTARMSFDMFTALVDDLHELGTRKIKFVGRGENFLHPRFVDMVEYAKKKGLNSSITTNGSLVTPADICRLVSIGLDEIFVSVDAASAKTYQQIHQRTQATAFDHIKRTLLNISEERARQAVTSPSMHLSFVIQNNNYFEMPEMVRLAREVGAERVAFSRISVYKGTRPLMLDDQQNAELLELYLPEVDRLAQQLGIATNSELFHARPSQVQRSRCVHTKIPCYIGWYFSIILADGTVNPCCEGLRKLGSLKTDRFKDIWSGEPYRRFRKEISELPKSQGQVRGCRCYNCGFALHNHSVHRLLHPLSSDNQGLAGYHLTDLKRLIFGSSLAPKLRGRGRVRREG